jgi:hypothetical protein
MIATRGVPLGEIGEFLAHSRRAGLAGKLAQLARQVPVMVAVGKRGRRFTRGQRRQDKNQKTPSNDENMLNAIITRASMEGRVIMRSLIPRSFYPLNARNN